ncbi:Pentatricopeptide repeat-containing protein [Abeliophyllum distichum]|uniref:Pentatricopeptide repeat-containing protein n=1 Tax=Abeliophyllum distichum TaxID=126358 RepID=A0ABD1QLQ3_9LAMI
MVNMHAKRDSTCSAEKFFKKVPVKDIVSWNTLIGAMVKSATPARAFDLFMEMCVHGFLPNETTFVNVLNSCTTSQTSPYGELIHAKMIKKRFESDVTGQYEKNKELFALVEEPDIVSWNILIAACSRNGDYKQGMELFGQMKSKYRVEPEMDHYLLVVDLLARYGYLKEAERLILGMPFPPNALIWRIFLEGCKRQRTMEDLALAA